MSNTDPFTEIREALRTMASPSQIAAALGALARLEREAAERETALADYQSECAVLTSERVAAEARVREVEAERDKANEKHADHMREHAEGVWIKRSAMDDLRATVARQAEALGRIRDNRCTCGGRFKWSGTQLRCEQCNGHNSPSVPREIARAVLASPEAAATEPLACECGHARHEHHFQGYIESPCSSWHCGCSKFQPAALPAVDAPPLADLSTDELVQRAALDPYGSDEAAELRLRRSAVDAPPEPTT